MALKMYVLDRHNHYICGRF